MSFKVGDWVMLVTTYSRTIAKVSENKTIQENGVGKKYTTDLDMWEAWKPKESEWCWIDRVLCKITFMNEYEPDEFYFIDSANQNERKGFFSISKIEPFIGKLPSFIKD